MASPNLAPRADRSRYPWHLTADQQRAARHHFGQPRRDQQPDPALRTHRDADNRSGPPPDTGTGNRASEDDDAGASLTRDSLQNEGFIGFARLRDLDMAKIPEMAGVYVLLRENPDRPEFLAASTGGHFKGNDPTVNVSVLEQRWVNGAHCVYIGMATKTDSTNLRRRIKTFRQYGNGQPVGHQGGRYVWQVADASDYLIGWKTMTGHPRPAEHAMIHQFTRQHGRHPFGNISP